jgi:hypothetical protein
MDIENRRVNTFEPGHLEKRYFGRDITNTEHNLFASRDAAKSRPEFKSIDVDKKRHAGPKPSPTHFYRNLLDNQKKIHRRLPAAAAEHNRSGAHDRREAASRSKGRADPADPSDALLKPELVKQNLSKLLKVKHRQGPPAAEASQDRLPSGPEHHKSRDRPLDGRKPSTVRELSNQAKFHSLVQVAPTTKASSVACRQPQSLLPAQQARPFAGSQAEQEKQCKKLLGNKFQNLRLQIEEQRREDELPRAEDRAAPDGPAEPRDCFDNELEAAAATDARAQEKLRLRRQFDLPFIWEFLLARDVRSAD